jgi:hypothetical protein
MSEAQKGNGLKSNVWQYVARAEGYAMRGAISQPCSGSGCTSLQSAGADHFPFPTHRAWRSVAIGNVRDVLTRRRATHGSFTSRRSRFLTETARRGGLSDQRAFASWKTPRKQHVVESMSWFASHHLRLCGHLNDLESVCVAGGGF